MYRIGLFLSTTARVLATGKTARLPRRSGPLGDCFTQSPLGDALRRAVALTLQGSLCGVVGYAVMVAKVPERWVPGAFDLWGHSHQWWHVLTILGPVLCLEAGRVILAARLQDSCPA